MIRHLISVNFIYFEISTVDNYVEAVAYLSTFSYIRNQKTEIKSRIGCQG